MRQEILDRYQDNIARVRNLVTIYEGLGRPGQGRRPVNSTDLLRAATVLLHSAFEDFLRSLAHWKWPDAAREVIDDIPLVGTSPSGRPEKFFLGSLVTHRAKPVQEVIQESVKAYLERLTVNSSADAARLLQSLGVNVQQVNHTFNTLDEFMQRRHHIVHQADRNPHRGRGQHRAQSLGTWQVNAWLDIVEEFVRLVDQRVPD